MARLLAQWNHKAGVEFTRIHKETCEFEPDTFDINGNETYSAFSMEDDECDCSDCVANRVERVARRAARNSNDNPKLPSVLESIRTIINADENLKKLIWNVGTDPGCLEIPSAPLNEWKDLRKFYMQINSICKKHNYTANQNAVGTGSHIHVEHLENHVTIMRVMRDMYYRPYVKWAFANPQDDYNCAPLAIGIFPHWEFNRFRARHYGERRYSLTHSGRAIAVQSETLEFRLFDMTWNWGEQEEHMAYVQAYMTWVKSDKYVAPAPMKYKRFDKIPMIEAVKAFKDHIEQLGLPWERYEKYVGYIEGHYQWKNLGDTMDQPPLIHTDARRTLEENIAKYDTLTMRKELTTAEFRL